MTEPAEFFPWDPMENEPALWFDRFTKFRLMGPERSLLGLYKQWLAEKGRAGQKKPAELRPPGAWVKASRRWKWRDRGEAWDAHERFMLVHAEEEERAEFRRKRRDLLTGFLGKLAGALDAFSGGSSTLGDLTKAVQTFVQEARNEFDDLPTQKHAIGVTLSDVLAGLPEGFREEVRAALAETVPPKRD